MNTKKTFLIFTNEKCLIENQSYSSIPLMLDSANNVVEAASDWFRHLILIRRRSSSSVRQFAYQLHQWWKFLQEKNVAWYEVDDYKIAAWRDSFLDRQFDKTTVNSLVLTVFKFYLWAEKNGHTTGLIGETDISRNFRPRLSVIANTNKNKRVSYTTPLLIRNAAKPILPTPTNDDITKVHQALAEMYVQNTDLFIRDSLILMWMEGTGLRRAEVISLKCTDIPSWDEIQKLEENQDNAKICVVGKGSKKRIVFAGTDLLTQTLEYIETERKAIVKKFILHKNAAYKKPKSIFLSNKTGVSLNVDSVSQLFAKAFRKAGVRGSGHRVRARFLTNLVTGLLEAQFEKFKSLPDAASVLLPAAQIAGHNHIETLRPYLDLAKKALLQDTHAMRLSTARDKATVVNRQYEITKEKLKIEKEFESLLNLVELGKEAAAIKELRKLIRDRSKN